MLFGRFAVLFSSRSWFCLLRRVRRNAHFLEDTQSIPLCPPDITEMLIKDPSSATLNKVIQAFNTILASSPKDVLNLKTTASLVCAQLSFVTYFDPYTKVKRYKPIDKQGLNDLRDIYNMMVAISVSDNVNEKKDKNKNKNEDYEFISMLLHRVLFVMKEKLTKSAPELF